MDTGRVLIPEDIKLPRFPPTLLTYVQEALARILDPIYDSRDLVFQRQRPLALGAEVKGDEALDREVRAVFICLLATLLGEYQNFVTVLRFNPSPAFHFNQVCEIYSGASDKGPSGKRTASLERTVRNVPKLSFPIAIIHSSQCVFYSEFLCTM